MNADFQELPYKALFILLTMITQCKCLVFEAESSVWPSLALTLQEF